MSNLNTNVFIELISNDGFVATSKHLIRKLGLLEATLIGELCSEHKYWAAKRDDFDSWFPSTIANIEENCGISRKLQEKTISTLSKHNIIEMKNMGLPAKRHFKINTDALYKLFEQNIEQNTSSNKIVPMGQTRLPHGDKQDSPSGANSNNNINNIKENNINKNISPNPNSTIVDEKATNEATEKDKELKNNCGFVSPKHEDVIAYSKTFGEILAIDPDWFYEYNNKRGWTDKNGIPIKAWKALFNNWNSLNTTRLRKEEEQKAHAKAKTQEHIQQIEAERIHNEKARAKELEGKTQMSCPKCGRKFPDKNIELSVYDSTLTCHICNHSWSFIKDKQQSNEQMAVV